MNTSLSWIKAYVPELDITAQEYTDAMTLSGTKVEGYEVLDADLDKIVIGQIDKIEKHPDADKLLYARSMWEMSPFRLLRAPIMYTRATRFRWCWTEDGSQAAMSLEAVLQAE